MSDIQQRIARALQEELAPWMTGFCWGVEAEVNGDSLLVTVDELSDALAGVLVSELKLTREEQSVPIDPNEGRWTPRTREAAEDCLRRYPPDALWPGTDDPCGLLRVDHEYRYVTDWAPE